MIRRPPISTPFPTRRSSDLCASCPAPGSGPGGLVCGGTGGRGLLPGQGSAARREAAISSAAPRSRSSAASSRPSRSASAGGPVIEPRTPSLPSTAVTEARRNSSGPSSPSASSAYAATGAVQPASSAASVVRSATSEEHTSELLSCQHLVRRLLLEKNDPIDF